MLTRRRLSRKQNLLRSSNRFKPIKRLYRRRSLLLAALLFVLAIGSPVIAKVPVSAPVVQSQPLGLQLVQQGKALYAAGRFDEAARIWQQAAASFATQGDTLNQAMALSNLSSTLLALGQGDKANQAIAQSLNLLQTQKSTPEQLRILAQTKDIQAQLQLAVGQAAKAIDTWQQAADIYIRIGNQQQMTHSRINQAQAMQDLGLYPRACKTLLAALELDYQNCELSEESLQILKNQPASLLKVLGLNALGNVLRVVGRSEQSQNVLVENLKLAQQLNSPQDIAAAYLSLGNTMRARANTEALNSSKRAEYRQVGFRYYEQAALSASPTTQIFAQLNQLSLLLESERWKEAGELRLSLKSQLNSLPLNRAGIYAQINFAQSLLKLAQQKFNPTSLQLPSFKEIDQILVTAADAANRWQDEQTEAYALGLRGRLYEQHQLWEQAENFTKQALNLAPTFKTPNIAYQLLWQLGRLRNAQGDHEGAIANYTQAVNTLQSLRSDLVTISSDVQFSFRESVEPVYRELVGLLLQPQTKTASQKSLVQAREVIESLQLAELDNFFREACTDANPAQIDQIDNTAAVFYPIILSDRLEVILALPGQKLRQYTTFLPKEQIEGTLKNLVEAVTIPRLQLSLKRFLAPSQQVYDWLIRPVEAELEASGVKTLVFVPDGAIRNLPVSALHDGKQYLVEKYSVAIAPALQLVDPQPLARQQLQVLAFGLTEARQGFEALPNVQLELDRIKAGFDSQIRLNQSFTTSSFKQAIQTFPFPVVHLATHGEFSSDAKDTFVLTWDDRITANDFADLLLSTQQDRNPIELLILSACQTAEGDERAALGLAGVAVRAGSRSTLASLWFVSDEATSLLMAQFYQELATTKETKAEALRRAQAMILQNDKFSHPYFWSAFVMVGNWL